MEGNFDSLGKTIKALWEEKRLPLRVVAAALGLDQAILSKIERNIRWPNRELVIRMAAYFKIDENILLIDYASDKVVAEIANYPNAIKVLQAAEDKVSYYQRLSFDELLPSQNTITLGTFRALLGVLSFINTTM